MRSPNKEEREDNSLNKRNNGGPTQNTHDTLCNETKFKLASKYQNRSLTQTVRKWIFLSSTHGSNVRVLT